MLVYTMPFLISFSLQSVFEVLLLWFICLFWLPCLFSACLKVHRNDNLGSSRCFFRLQIFLMLHPNHIFKHIRTIENECEVVCCQDFFFFLFDFKSGNSRFLFSSVFLQKFINNWVIWYKQRNWLVDIMRFTLWNYGKTVVDFGCISFLPEDDWNTVSSEGILHTTTSQPCRRHCVQLHVPWNKTGCASITHRFSLMETKWLERLKAECKHEKSLWLHVHTACMFHPSKYQTHHHS